MGINARATALALLLAVPVFGQVVDGDRHYDARAKAGEIDAAIAAYQRAIAANANDVEAHWKLLRAYRFKGAYNATTNVITTTAHKLSVSTDVNEASSTSLERRSICAQRRERIRNSGLGHHHGALR